MEQPLVYLNGRFLPSSEAALPFHDAGFVFGATVTDLCRTFHHRLFRLSDHLARFRRGCLYARVPQPLSDAELASSAEELVQHNAARMPAEEDLALVLIATPGPIGYYSNQPGGPGDGPPTLVMHTFSLPFTRYARLFREGAHLIIPSIPHIPAICVDPRVKQRSRLHWWLAEQEVHAADAVASALLLDVEGHVTETARANFLVVRAGAVLSPPRQSILEGISLRVVEELCREQGIPFYEQPLGVYACLNADEALLTSTPYCIAGVSRINGVAVPWPGPLGERLLQAWTAQVGLNIRQQILRDL